MATLAAEQILALLQPYVGGLTGDGSVDEVAHPELVEKLSIYLELLVVWNARMNLTSVRDPEQMVRRHFGESLFAARHLTGTGRLLDLGSGAGFPGIPIQLWYPRLHVTLAESQTKKAVFLREVVRSLGLGTEIWQGRVQDMAPNQRFDTVILRAVDDTVAAIEVAQRLSADEVWVMGSERSVRHVGKPWRITREIEVPGEGQTRLFRLRRSVPRGTP